MIKNLNPLTFYPFGNILDNTKELLPNDYTSEHCKLNNNSLTYLEKSSDETYITIEDGVTLIYVGTSPELSELQLFLLDKSIMIHKDIYFGIIPYGQFCEFTRGTSPLEDLSSIMLGQPLSPTAITPTFNIGRIHTLFYQEKEKAFRFKGEKHAFWELTYVDQGTLETNVDGKKYVLQQGDCIFYAPKQYHTQQNLNTEPLCFMTLTFDMTYDDDDFLSDVIFHLNRQLKEQLEKILWESKHYNLFSGDLILSYLTQFVIELIRHAKLGGNIKQIDTDTQNNVESNIVMRAIEYITDNVDKKITVDQIAGAIPISNSYLSKLFKKHTKKTIVEYVNDFKLEKSKELIRHSCYNFTEISSILGYTSVHYFSKQFKKKFGVTPTTYSKALHYE